MGVLIALVGLDPQSGVRRFSPRTVGVLGSIDFIAVIIGVFTFAEVFLAVEQGKRSVSLAPLGRLMPPWADIRRCVGARLRSTGGLGTRQNVTACALYKVTHPSGSGELLAFAVGPVEGVDIKMPGWRGGPRRGLTPGRGTGIVHGMLLRASARGSGPARRSVYLWRYTPGRHTSPPRSPVLTPERRR